jgi:hypothetical protein
MGPTSKRVLVAILFVIACFAAGIGAARWMGRPGAASASKDPTIAIDTSAVTLLPDASLRLDHLPRGFDAGASER